MTDQTATKPAEGTGIKPPATISDRAWGSHDVYGDPELFGHYQRVARMLSLSPFIPNHLRGRDANEALGNCFVVCAIARAQRQDPVLVAQQIHFIEGRFGWATRYMIQRANESGVFDGRIKFVIHAKGETITSSMDGQERTVGESFKAEKVRWEGPRGSRRRIVEEVDVINLAVTAFADLAGVEGDGRRVSVTLDLVGASAEGWFKNEKYLTIPIRMLQFRCASWLINMTCPEVMFGLPTQEEIEDRGQSLAPQQGGFYAPAAPVDGGEAEVIDATGEEVAAAAEPEPEEEATLVHLIDHVGEVCGEGLPIDDALSKLAEMVDALGNDGDVVLLLENNEIVLGMADEHGYETADLRHVHELAAKALKAAEAEREAKAAQAAAEEQEAAAGGEGPGEAGTATSGPDTGADAPDQAEAAPQEEKPAAEDGIGPIGEAFDRRAKEQKAAEDAPKAAADAPKATADATPEPSAATTGTVRDARGEIVSETKSGSTWFGAIDQLVDRTSRDDRPKLIKHNASAFAWIKENSRFKAERADQLWAALKHRCGVTNG